MACGITDTRWLAVDAVFEPLGADFISVLCRCGWEKRGDDDAGPTVDELAENGKACVCRLGDFGCLVGACAGVGDGGASG